MNIGIIIVDHGSRSSASNEVLDEVVKRFARRVRDRFAIVEGAHMELAEPSIEHAFGRCVARGADHVVVVPFFLGPGKHLTVDIPQLVADAAHPFVGVTYQIAGPLGVDDLMLRLIEKRVAELPAVVQHEGQYDPSH